MSMPNEEIWDEVAVDKSDAAFTAFVGLVEGVLGNIPLVSNVIASSQSINKVEFANDYWEALDEFEGQVSNFSPEITTMATKSGARLFVLARVYRVPDDSKTATGKDDADKIEPITQIRSIGVANTLEHAIVKSVVLQKDGNSNEINPSSPSKIKHNGHSYELRGSIYISVDLVVSNGKRRVTAKFGDEAVRAHSRALSAAKLVSDTAITSPLSGDDFLADLELQYLSVRNIPYRLFHEQVSEGLSTMYTRNMEGILRLRALERTFENAASKAKANRFLSILTSTMQFAASANQYVLESESIKAENEVQSELKASLANLRSEIGEQKKQFEEISQRLKKWKLDKEKNRDLLKKIVSTITQDLDWEGYSKEVESNASMIID